MHDAGLLYSTKTTSAHHGLAEDAAWTCRWVAAVQLVVFGVQASSKTTTRTAARSTVPRMYEPDDASLLESCWEDMELG
jgi:hypothetical protein